jgi:hypothetical protein
MLLGIGQLEMDPLKPKDIHNFCLIPASLCCALASPKIRARDDAFLLCQHQDQVLVDNNIFRDVPAQSS